MGAIRSRTARASRLRRNVYSGTLGGFAAAHTNFGNGS